MRFCYAHFPINVTAVGDVVEIRNFLGEKNVRRIPLLDGVKYTRTADVKDQIEISGIDITKVSLSCAKISQSCNVKNKDIRKFLDGIYVTEKPGYMYPLYVAYIFLLIIIAFGLTFLLQSSLKSFKTKS